MLERLIIAAALVAAIVLAGVLVRAAIRRRTHRLVGHRTEGAGDVATLLYFTSPYCAPCKLQQEPALELLREEVPSGFHLKTIDVSIDPDEARRYGVLSAPTTVLIDALGTVQAVNVGPASSQQLAAQIRDLSTNYAAQSAAPGPALTLTRKRGEER